MLSINSYSLVTQSPPSPPLPSISPSPPFPLPSSHSLSLLRRPLICKGRIIHAVFPDTNPGPSWLFVVSTAEVRPRHSLRLSSFLTLAQDDLVIYIFHLRLYHDTTSLLFHLAPPFFSRAVFFFLLPFFSFFFFVFPLTSKVNIKRIRSLCNFASFVPHAIFIWRDCRLN